MMKLKTYKLETAKSPIAIIGKCLVLLAFIALTGSAFSQDKYEKELRVQEEEVPKEAVEFVKSLKISPKVKWYKEHGLDKTSFEAKTKFKGRRHSIEFSEKGYFEDLEIEINPDGVPDDSYEKITGHFETQLSNYSIRKIQIQYSGDEEDVLEFFNDEEEEDDVTIKYEIVISTKIEGAYEMFEYLFDEDGKFIEKSKIVLNMSDNIEY